MVDDGSGPTIEIFDGDLVVFDAEVLINRGQKIAGTVPMGNRVLTELISGADELAALNAAAGPDVGEGARPDGIPTHPVEGIGIDSNRFIGFFVRLSTDDNEVHSCSSGLGDLWRAGLG